MKKINDGYKVVIVGYPNVGKSSLFNRLIASIGIRVRKKISFHGISVNIYPNLNFFDKIIPCGLENSKATSAKELGVKISYNDF